MVQKKRNRGTEIVRDGQPQTTIQGKHLKNASVYSASLRNSKRKCDGELIGGKLVYLGCRSC